MRINQYYIRIYCVWMNFFLMGLGPFLVLITLNTLILRHLIIISKEHTSISQVRLLVSSVNSREFFQPSYLSSIWHKHSKETLVNGHAFINICGWGITRFCIISRFSHQCLAGPVVSSSKQSTTINNCNKPVQPDAIYEIMMLFSPQNNNIGLAKVGLTIAVVYVLCHSVRWVPNCYELYRTVWIKNKGSA